MRHAFSCTFSHHQAQVKAMDLGCLCMFAELLPALERMGKTARMMIDPEQVMFVQQSDDGTDGALLKLELPTVCCHALS